jgi:predicted RNase H-like nuclease (RuvC/YqgF family)
MAQKDRLTEIENIIRELAISQKKTDYEVEKVSKEVIRVSKEVTRMSKEVERMSKEVTRVSKEVERVSKEVERVSKEVERVSKEVEKVNKMVGDLTDGWGKFVIGLFEPSVEDCIKSLGLEVLEIEELVKRRIKDEEYEVDLLAITRLNGKPKILIFEIKSSINQQKIEDFIDKRLKKFKKFFFEYKGIDLLGAVAGVRFAKGAKEWALNQGLFIFSTAKGILRNLTPSGFKPKIW